MLRRDGVLRIGLGHVLSVPSSSGKMLRLGGTGDGMEYAHRAFSPLLIGEDAATWSWASGIRTICSAFSPLLIGEDAATIRAEPVAALAEQLSVPSSSGKMLRHRPRS